MRCNRVGISQPFASLNPIKPQPADRKAFCAMKPAAYFLVTFLSICRFTVSCERADEVDGNVVRAASKLMLDEHLRQDVDPRQLAHAWARQFLLTLDPLRMHFLASDEDEFMKQAHMLFADAQDGKVEFPLLVAKRFRARFDENASSISKLLDEEHNFTIEESVQIEHKNYALDKTACDERWRLRIKYELLMENPNDPNAKSSREFLRGRYSRIQKHFRSLAQPKILSLYIDSLAKALDPHSAYFDEPYLIMYRTSHIPNYSLGFRLAYRDGDLWIQPTRSEMAFGAQSLAGYRIVAVRIKGQDPIHLTGLTDGTAIRTIISPIAELGHAEAVILDIENPKIGQRKVVACDRWLPVR